MLSRISLSKVYFLSLFILSVLVASAGTAAASNTKAVNSPNRKAQLWKEVVGRAPAAVGRRQMTPDRYRVFSLDQDVFRSRTADVPAEFSADAQERTVVLEVPMPDGKLSRFRIEETQNMAQHLADAFPTWRTMRGYGIDDTTATGQFTWTSKGFSGYIFASGKVAYIDPYQENDTNNYYVYYKDEFGRPTGEFSCRGGDEFSELLSVDRFKQEPHSFATEFTNGANIRTYRLAVATTGEWARGTTMSVDPLTVRTSALAALVVSVTRLDGIFRRELSVTLTLVNPPIANDMTNIIFDDPATDPYNNTDGIPQLAINQTTLNARVGIPNYDVGHLYGTGGGGVASSPSICSTQKAEGYSARAGFYGDPFTVDYAAHELGHQFGADHTYNNTDPGGACTTRSATDAFEVASGSTLMSYVGICSQRNLQQYVDTGIPMFHIRSLTTMVANIQDPGNGGSCGTAGMVPNAIPTVNAGAAFTIPRLTPFTLTAVGADADAGDVLSYSWEQYDLAPSASGQTGVPANTYDVDTDGILRPLFRVYSPVASPSRTFPSLTFILNPAGNNPAGSNNPPLTFTGTHPTNAPGATCEPMVTCVIGENLPSVARTMNFRVSVRDQKGGTVDGGTTVTVSGATGPFQVTAPNNATVWQGGSTKTVTWDVNGSNANAANVNILLSTDGGLTFPTTLLANAPNNGTANVVVPNTPTTTARVRIDGAGNIFFDISNVNFFIVPDTAAPANVSGRISTADGRGISRVIVTLTGQDGLVRRTISSAFGYYRFEDVGVGETYVLTVASKRYTFAQPSRIITVQEDIGDADFVSNE